MTVTPLIATEQGRFETSGFFVLRSPMLPFDDFLHWSVGVSAPHAVSEDEARQAVASDTTVLRKRLMLLVDRPLVVEALFIASPDLSSSMEAWRSAPDSDRGKRVERSLVRYVSRMAGRPTPFGMFASYSVGSIGEATTLAIDSVRATVRRTRLDMDYLGLLAQAVRENKLYISGVPLRSNPTIWKRGPRGQYIDTRFRDRMRSYHLVAVDIHEALSGLLHRAAEGATFTELSDALTSMGAPPDVIEPFLHQLVSAGLLLPAVEPTVTGGSPTDDLIARLRTYPALAEWAERLSLTRASLCELDENGIGAPPTAYSSAATHLESLPVTTKPARLIQVDVCRPATHLCVSLEVVARMLRGAEMLQRLLPPVEDPLYQFAQRFEERHDRAQVPLMEALDEDTGLGQTLVESPGEAQDGGRSLEKNVLLQRLLGRKLHALSGPDGIHLSADEVESVAFRAPTQLPDAFSVFGACWKENADDTAVRVQVASVFGPSGATAFGRFCGTDDRLTDCVVKHLRQEEALEPGAVFAEVVHLPQARMGNVIARPVLRDYEIPFLGESGAVPDRQIDLDDLLVSVRDGIIYLHSKKLERRVIPRLTTAHNYTNGRNLSLYKFLCALQTHPTPVRQGWDWGDLQHLAFLPRVTLADVVVARAQWRVDRGSIDRCTRGDTVQRFLAVQSLRKEQRWPRYVLLADYDNQLPVDLDNVLSVDSFAALLAGRDDAILKELFPSPDQLLAAGPEGRYVHEIIVPFVRANRDGVRRSSGRQYLAATRGREREVFTPGSEWMYAKLYTGVAAADLILQEVVQPWIAQLRERGLCRQWFFLRYGDPDAHLRVRVNGEPQDLASAALPALRALCLPWMECGLLRKIQLDTYERELERYGGAEGTSMAEEVFCVDSDAVVRILSCLRTDDVSESRKRVAYIGVDRLFAAFGLTIEQRKALLLTGDRLNRARENRTLRHSLGQQYRNERAFLEPSVVADSDHLPAYPDEIGSALAARSTALRCRASAFQELVGRHHPTQRDSVLLSYAHMYLNRLLRMQTSDFEAQVYDHLVRCYEALLARGAKH